MFGLRAPTRPLSFVEMIALLAAMMSVLAFSIDSILPALPEIADAMVPEDPIRAQLIIAAFVFGTGIGQLVFGPFSDSYGRRPAMVVGITLFILGALGGHQAQTLEQLLAFRLLQGIGAAAPRLVAQAITRDMFSGREQARVGSLTFMFFVVVPALAPLIGQQLIRLGSWQTVFTAYVIFGAVIMAWFLARQPETLNPENARPFRVKSIWAATVEVLTNRVALRYLGVMSLGFGQLIAYISAAQHVYVDALGAGEAFPLYFALVALLSSVSGFINSRVVMRLGMRSLAQRAFGSQVVFAGLLWMAWTFGLMDGLSMQAKLWVFVGWSVTLFFMNGLTFGNVTALAMEPLGHIAGTASAILGALSSAASVIIALPISMAFDGTPRPLMLGAVVCSALALWLVWGDRARERAATAASA